MRILHAVLMSTPQRGILQQMTWEAEAARALGLPWRSVVFGPSVVADQAPDLVARAPREPGFERGGGPAAVREWLRWRRGFYAWLREQARSADLVLLRHTLHDPLRPWAVRRLGVPVVSVHHTLEVPELLAGGRRRAARVEQAVGGASLRRGAGIVGVTEEILRYEQSRMNRPLPGHVYPNGTMIPVTPLPGEVPDYEAPQLLFVSDEFVPWHGLDRLLASLAKSEEPLLLHVVGTLSDEDRAAAEQEPRVVLHGRLTPAGIAALARTCTVGLTSFALDRKDMTQACTLKVREYLQQGLPVYAGHLEVFPESFPYVRSGTADVASIVAYARTMAGTRRETVRDTAAPYIDKRMLLADLYGWLGTVA